MIYTLNINKFKGRYFIRKNKNIQYRVENSCWICVSHCKDKDGYPLCNFKNFYRMSRFIYTCFKGVITKGLVVRHTCDNPQCIHPKHLILGTSKQNTADAIKRKGHLIGAKNPNARITLKQVNEIRKRQDTQRNLAKKFKLSRTQIQRIQCGYSWA